MGGGHFDGHVWRWVIVPPDLVRCAQIIITKCVRYKSMRERQHMPNEIAWWDQLRTNAGGTVTRLHMWQQDGRRGPRDRLPVLDFCGFLPLYVYMPSGFHYSELILYNFLDTSRLETVYVLRSPVPYKLISIFNIMSGGGHLYFKLDIILVKNSH